MTVQSCEEVCAAPKRAQIAFKCRSKSVSSLSAALQAGDFASIDLEVGHTEFLCPVRDTSSVLLTFDTERIKKIGLEMTTKRGQR